MNRRNFLKMTGAAATAISTKDLLFPGTASAATTPHMTWSIFSRHLQWVSTAAVAASDPYGTGVAIGQAALAADFSAVDLTVRSQGHVEPTLVTTNLPLMLNGIRSTGCICDQITTGINPTINPADTTWIASQFVNQILSTAAANGIKRYRIGAVAYTANTFGTAMTTQLDGLRVNMRRLAQIGAANNNITAMYHTFNSDIGTGIYDLMYVYSGMDPNLLGINYAVGHIVTDGPQSLWSQDLRYGMPNIKGLALQDVVWIQDPTTLRWSSPTVVAGTGMINWLQFFQLLLAGGYNGPADLQIEYTIVGANGTSVSLNNTFFADNAQFTSGNLTPAIMIANLKHEVDYYKVQAAAAGWTASQLT
jgi:sugar phosphate isomerase/epimerase